MLPQFVHLPLRRASLRRAPRLHLRSIVTSSIEPSLDARIERPETFVLTESSLYSNSTNTNTSWREAFESFYPKQGLHFSSIDMLRSADESTLAGLVLVDPLLLPDDGRVKKHSATSSEEVVDNRWESSLQDFMSLLDGNAPNMYKHAGKIVGDSATHPLFLGDRTATATNTIPTQLSESKSTLLDIELSLLNSIARNKHRQQLLLEPGIVPMLIFYSSGVNNDYEDYYRICAERTATFHTCAGSSDYFDQVSVAKIPTIRGGSGDDLDHLMKQIYEWYDDVVA
mmetsp:Transcript_14587/g.29884  ORF Transcript_14587/g.29884 Transcript_14587/m.29884 type:complete len:284 (+) Transcript_14587:2499-3350(+)